MKSFLSHLPDKPEKAFSPTLFVSHFFHSITKTYVCPHIASKRIELERPITSQNKDNFKGFPTVIKFLMFQYS